MNLKEERQTLLAALKVNGPAHTEAFPKRLDVEKQLAERRLLKKSVSTLNGLWKLNLER